MVALLLSTLLGRPGIYTPWKERANGNKMARVGGCDSRIVSRRYAIFIVNGPANEQGKGGIRVLYVRETSDIRGDRLITCSRYSGFKRCLILYVLSKWLRLFR